MIGDDPETLVWETILLHEHGRVDMTRLMHAQLLARMVARRFAAHDLEVTAIGGRAALTEVAALHSPDEPEGDCPACGVPAPCATALMVTPWVT